MLHRLTHMGISFDAKTCNYRDQGPERFAKAVRLTCANGYNPTSDVRDCPFHGYDSSLPPEPTAIVTSSRILPEVSSAICISGGRQVGMFTTPWVKVMLRSCGGARERAGKSLAALSASHGLCAAGAATAWLGGSGALGSRRWARIMVKA